MNCRLQEDVEIATPALVFDSEGVAENVRTVNRLVADLNCHVLFSLKACSVPAVMSGCVGTFAGFSCSSFFEARLAREILGCQGSVHYTSPGLRPDEVEAIADTCDCVVFNSLGQLKNYHERVSQRAECGLRINPERSYVSDCRYDPCRTDSKLGVRIGELQREDLGFLTILDGIHFHTNCDSEDLRPLLETVEHIDRHLPRLLDHIRWVNLGGGYSFTQAKGVDAFSDAIRLLRHRHQLETYIEPGADIVRSAGHLVATVLDVQTGGSQRIAILDTSVNHMPEVFEYQFEPDVHGHVDSGSFTYVLAGCTCLAGDVFGEYAFAEPLHVGSRVVFENVGAYTTVKWHMFNGINLPTIYVLSENGELELIRRFTYEDFASRCGVARAAV